MVLHLLMPPDHAPCSAVPPTLTWLEVGGHVFQPLYIQNFSELLVVISPIWMGEVGVEVLNQYQVHSVRTLDDRHGDMLGLGRAARQDVAPNNEPPNLPHHQL